jgi:putative transposase
VLELFSRKLLACPTSTHPDAELACDAIKIAMTVRGGGAVVGGVVFHTDLGSTHTATLRRRSPFGESQSTLVEATS